ncbi:hypothetical protein MMC31_004523 [Peltigera leucophlebia]|nr:hypothetical protein [Peltigera leucophlebia]
MPLQRLTMKADYSERPIYPLRQRSTRNQPRAVLISSTRTTKPTKSSFAFFNTPLRIPHRDSPARRGSVLVCRGIQGRLAGCGPFHPGLNFKAKTRKFEDFSVDGEVAMVRGIPTPLDTLYPRRNMVPKNVYVNDLNFVLPPRLISQTASQSTTVPNPEDLDTSLTSQHPATQNLAGISTSSQPPNGSESNGPVTNWSQAVLSSCVVGVALVAVATGYACTTVFRGALNVGQFVYTNRESIRQTATTCTKAVQSTYNAAKRRMVSIPPRLPVGMRRRYAAPTTPHARSWRCPLFRRSRIAAQSPAQPSPPINPVVSTLAPEGMPGVEYSGLSNAGQFPGTQDAADPDAFILPRSSNALASGALPYMTGGLFRESIPPPPAPSPVPDQPASNNISGTPYPDGPYPDAMELTEQPCICYEESVFSDDIEDEYEVEDRENTKVPTAELFKEDAEHMALEEDFWSLPGQFEPRKSLTNPQAKSTSASPVFETAPPNIEATAPVIEHASPSTIINPGTPVIEPESPLPTPPGAFPPPPPPSGRPTPSPPPPAKAIARQGVKNSRKRKTARGANKMAKSHANPPLPPIPTPLKRKASSPPRDVRRSNRIAELNN